jgi:hypothetical protein
VAEDVCNHSTLRRVISVDPIWLSFMCSLIQLLFLLDGAVKLLLAAVALGRLISLEYSRFSGPSPKLAGVCDISTIAIVRTLRFS